ncbi:hypothetical protein JXA40_08885 [bacterium]|nr:hypothetical protein [candidate division CSSED10-310 bacterium]
MHSEVPSFRQFSSDFLIVIAASVFLLSPLGHPRFFWSHDEAQLLWRITECHQNFICGYPLARWFPDFARGMGLPFLEYFPVVFLYFTESFRLAGLSTIHSAKIAIVLVTWLGSAGAYLLAREYWGRAGGIVSGLLYTYAPYRIFDLYVRGDVNEYTAIALLPLNLWLLNRCSSGHVRGLIHIPTALLTGTLFASHYPSAVIHLPVYVFWIAARSISTKNPVRVSIQCLTSLGAGLILSSPWWANAFLSRNLVQMEGMTRGFADYRHQFIHPVQWFSFYWNFGASVKGTGDTVSFQLGNIALILSILGFPAWITRLFRSGREQPLWPLLALLTASLFLTASASGPVWKLIPVLPMIQFPYRILQIPALILALWGGSLAVVVERNLKWPRLWIASGLGAFILLFSLHMCRVAEYLNVDESQLTPATVARVAHTHCTGEFLPEHVGKRFPPPGERQQVVIEKIPDEGFSRKQMEMKLQKWIEKAPDIEYWKGDGIPLGMTEIRPRSLQMKSGTALIRIVREGPVLLELQAEATGVARIRWGQFYFPGWIGYCDGAPLDIYPDPDTGIVEFIIPDGFHLISIRYRNLNLGRNLEIMALAVFLLILGMNWICRIRSGHE